MPKINWFLARDDKTVPGLLRSTGLDTSRIRMCEGAKQLDSSVQGRECVIQCFATA